MSKKRAKDGDGDGDDDEVDWKSVFPTSRIKAQLMNNEEVGRLSNKAAEYVGKTRPTLEWLSSISAFLSLSHAAHFLFAGACSALFFQELASEAAASSSSTHVTLEDVKQACTKYEFLKNVLDHVTEASAPKLPVKKKPKLDATVNEAIAVSEATPARRQAEITVDQDDYD